MSLQLILAEAAAELALFAALGFLLFSLDDFAVDFIHFVRLGWRRLFVYRRHPRADALALTRGAAPG